MAQAKDKTKKETKKAPAANVAEGQANFKEKCSVCHWADKTDKRIGPGLKGVFKRAKLFDDRPVNEANVRDLILKGGGKMVGFEDSLDPKQVDALIAYLKTL
jgi:cytochrome c2